MGLVRSSHDNDVHTLRAALFSLSLVSSPLPLTFARAEMKAALVFAVVAVAVASAHVCMLYPEQRGSIKGLDTPGLAIQFSASVLLSIWLCILN